MKAKVLVTGGAGFIGSHACKALAARGFEPVTYDDLSRGHRDLVQFGPFEEGSLNDADRLAAVIASHRPIACLHFAAFAYVGESVEFPERYWANNVGGTLTLSRALIAADVRALVLSSSCAVYGEPERLPLTEEHPLRPKSPYGATKAAAERALTDLTLAHPIRVACLRYFNAAGADPEGDVGERHDPEPHLIPRAILAALGRIDALDVLGTDWPTHDGTCVRDYIHVADLADAHVRALEHLVDGGRSLALNLGIGRGHSVGEVVRAVERVTGACVVLRHAPRRAGDPAKLVADASRAQTELQWQPRWPELEAMVEHAWRWHRRDLSR